MESLLGGCYDFQHCERWLHRHHNGSVNSKCTHTPKSICQVLISPLALDISAGAKKNCSKSRLYPNPSIQITFGRFIPNYRKKSLHFYVKKKQPSSKTDKYHCVVLKCLKCLSIFSCNVKHPVRFHDLHLRVVNNSYKNGSALRL